MGFTPTDATGHTSSVCVLPTEGVTPTACNLLRGHRLLDRNDAQRLKELEDENQRLKKLVANLASGEEYALLALNSARPTVIRKQFCI